MKWTCLVWGLRQASLRWHNLQGGFCAVIECVITCWESSNAVVLGLGRTFSSTSCRVKLFTLYKTRSLQNFCMCAYVVWLLCMHKHKHERARNVWLFYLLDVCNPFFLSGVSEACTLRRHPTCAASRLADSPNLCHKQTPSDPIASFTNQHLCFAWLWPQVGIKSIQDWNAAVDWCLFPMSQHNLSLTCCYVELFTSGPEISALKVSTSHLIVFLFTHTSTLACTQTHMHTHKIMHQFETTTNSMSTGCKLSAHSYMLSVTSSSVFKLPENCKRAFEHPTWQSFWLLIWCRAVRLFLTSLDYLCTAYTDTLPHDKSSASTSASGECNGHTTLMICIQLWWSTQKYSHKKLTASPFMYMYFELWGVKCIDDSSDGPSWGSALEHHVHIFSASTGNANRYYIW